MKFQEQSVRISGMLAFLCLYFLSGVTLYLTPLFQGISGKTENEIINIFTLYLSDLLVKNGTFFFQMGIFISAIATFIILIAVGKTKESWGKLLPFILLTVLFTIVYSFYG